MTHPDALPHDLPLAIGDNLFVVHGCVRMNAIVRFSRNMVVVRDGDDLTLIDPVRMDDAGLAALEDLGTVKHVLRLGPMHGIDDPFYVDRYQAEFWAFADGTTYTTPTPTHALSEGGDLPFPGAELFAFKHMTQTEGAILITEGPGTLVTCDGIQSYATPPHRPHTNVVTNLLMPLIGFPKETLIGPVWMKALVTDREGMHNEFKRLLELDFDRLIAAHGTFLATGAHRAVQAAVGKMFD